MTVYYLLSKLNLINNPELISLPKEILDLKVRREICPSKYHNSKLFTACYDHNEGSIYIIKELSIGSTPDLREVLLHEIAHALVFLDGGYHEPEHGEIFKSKYDSLEAIRYYKHKTRTIPKWYEELIS